MNGGGSKPNKLYGAAGDDNLNGCGFDDILAGGTGDDRLNARSGDDQLWGGEGDDLLLGGDGLDTAFYVGDYSSFDISLTANGRLILTDLDTETDGDEGTDTLAGVEQLVFGDGTVLDVASLAMAAHLSR